MLWQLHIGIGMQAGLVTHMYQIGFLRAHLLCKRYGIINRLMRSMCEGTKRIHYQHVDTTQGLIRCLGSRKHVGHKAQRPDAIAQNGQHAMHHLQRQHLDSLNGKWAIGLDGMKVQTGNAGIEYLLEQIGEAFAKMRTRGPIGKDIDITEAAEGAQVIYTSRVIVVLVGEKYSIQTVEGYSQHLLTKVGATVDQDACIVGFHQYRHA